MLAGGAFFFLKPTNRLSDEEVIARNNALVENDDVSEEAMSGKTSVNGNFMELMRLGKNYSCDFDYEDDQGNNTQGTVYVSDSGDKFRGTFEMTQTDGTSITTNILRDGDYNYMWSDQLPQGFKFVITEEDESFFGETASESAQSTGLNADQDMNFDCDSWRVQNSMFEVPSDIEFMDSSSYMNSGSGETSNPYMDDPCSACEKIPAGTSRDQCLQTLGC